VTEETIDCVNATLKDFVNWADSFVTTCLNNYFNYVTTPGSTIDISIRVINGYTVDSAFNLTKLNIELRVTTSFRIEAPKFNCVVMNRNELGWIAIVKLYVCALLVNLVCCKLNRF